MKFWPLILVLSVFLAREAGAWGRVGHAVVCEIAHAEVSKETRRAIDRLMRSDADFNRFAGSCSWADTPRKRSKEHYANFDRARDPDSVNGCASNTPCVISAIAHDLDRLESPDSSKAERLEALKFVGHWIGDVHQPLHVSFGDDRGANSIEVEGVCEGTLHGTWDTCMIEKLLGSNPRVIGPLLRAEITERERSSWQGTAVEWARESLTLARSPETDYCTLQETQCWYAPQNRTLEKDESKRTFVVTDAYLKKNGSVVRQRLKQAGVRLARALDHAFSGHHAKK